MSGTFCNSWIFYCNTSTTSLTRSRSIETARRQFQRHERHDIGCLTRRLCDKFLSPAWRKETASPRLKTEEEREKERKLIAEIKAAAKAPTAKPGSLEDAAFVVLTHRIPRRMGKWTMAPPDTPDADKDGW
jgi:hypothetical protein